MSWMTGIIHEPLTFLLDTCRLYHTGKLWSIQLQLLNVRSSIQTIILTSKSLEKKTLRIWPHPLGNCLLLNPLPTGISDAFCGGKYKPHPGMEGNSFHFLMNLCRYTCNSSSSPGVTASFYLNFLNSFNIVVKCTCIFCWH